MSSSDPPEGGGRDAGEARLDSTTETSTPASAKVSPAERRIGPYRLLRELGHGGMGTVYLAARADAQYQKRVAIKVVKLGAENEDVVRYFRRERQILAGLDHPNIARLLDGGATEDGLPYFVMEYIQGQPIDEYCDSGNLAITERLGLFRDVCSAVQYAHRNLIVHRDIKPSNIMVTPEGVARLLDFGIAKLLNPELSGDGAQSATKMAMTPEYASPEQARGEPITTATDVYSLGVVLYRLLTGHHPYRLTSSQPLEVLRAVVEQEPESPSRAIERTERSTGHEPEAKASATPVKGKLDKLRKRLQGDLDTIVLAALRKEPQRRYPSVEALSEDVRRHLEGLPITARKATFGYRAGKYVRRHLVQVTAATAFVSVLGSVAVALAIQSARLSKERTRAEDNLELARKAVDESLSSPAVAQPGGVASLELDELRRGLLAKAETFYLGIAQQEPRNEAIAADLAVAHSRLGDIYLRLESFADARREYSDAVSRFETLARDNPQKTEYQQNLAYCHDGIGRALMAWLETDHKPPRYSLADAMKEYDTAVNQLEELCRRAPDARVNRQELARSRYNRGILRYDRREYDLTEADFTQAIDLLQPLVAAKESAAELRNRRSPSQDLARVYNDFGTLDLQRRHFEAAAQWFDRAISTLGGLRKEDPANSEYGRELATFYNNLAISLFKQGRYRMAADPNHAAMSLFEELVRVSPSLEAERAKSLSLRDWILANVSTSERAELSASYDEFRSRARARELTHR